jgi:hypothetical protein
VAVSGFRIERLDGAGIAIADAHDVIVQNNVLARLGAAGIRAQASRAVTIRGNTIIRACQRDTSPTCAGIWLSGVDGFSVRRNEVYDSGPVAPGEVGAEGIAAAGSSAGELAANLVHDLLRPGIALEAGAGASADLQVAANRTWNCAHGIVLSARGGGSLARVRVENDASWAHAGDGVKVSAAGLDGLRSELAVVNDTLVANGGGGLRIESANVQAVTVRNVLASRNAAFPMAAASADGLTVDHNLVDGLRGVPGELVGSAAVEADPRLRRAAGFDVRVSAASPAIDAGAGDGAPASDLLGAPRPLRGGVDIGAYEEP